MDTQCLFCKIARGEMNTEFLYKSPTLVAFRDIHPKAPSHVLFVPLAHYATFNDIPEACVGIMTEITQAVQKVAKAEGVDQSGYRVIVNVNRDGGQEIFHLHVHLLGGRPIKGMG